MADCKDRLAFPHIFGLQRLRLILHGRDSSVTKDAAGAYADFRPVEARF